MDRLPLNNFQVSAFNAALNNDDASNLIAVLDGAILANGWPVDSRLRLGVELQDAVWCVASNGKPKCFEAIVDFIFKQPNWDQLPEQQRDGRGARFPGDVLCYIESRLSAAKPASISQIETELTPSFIAYLSTQPDDELDTMATKLTRQVGNGLSQLAENTRSLTAQRRFAESEVEAISVVVSKSVSDAASQVKAKLRL